MRATVTSDHEYRRVLRKVFTDNAVGEVAVEEWLTLVYDLWSDYCAAICALQQIFCYLDRCYILNSDVGSYRNVARKLFCKHFSNACDADIVEKTIASLLEMIAAERKGNMFSQHIIKNIFQMFCELQIYNQPNGLEDQLLHETEQFYQIQSDEKLESLPRVEFIRYVRRTLEEEESRFQNYCEPAPQTVKKMMKLLLSQFIERHKYSIVGITNSTAEPTSPSSAKFSQDRPFTQLVLTNDIENLRTLYTLYTLCKAMTVLRIAWEESIQAQITLHLVDSLCVKSKSELPITSCAITTSREQQRQLIPELLKFTALIGNIVQTAFSESTELESSMKVGLHESLNRNTTFANMTAQLLARYCDEILRSKPKKLDRTTATNKTTEIEIELLMSNVIIIFRDLHSKDYFETFYRRDLSKRLLSGRSSSYEAERQFVQKLKEECGAPFTYKLEGMFKELETSKNTFTKFAQDPNCRMAVKETGVEFECHVLAAAVWPHQSVSNLTKGGITSKSDTVGCGTYMNTSSFADFVLPPQAMKVQELFTDYYKKIHSGRVLQWILSAGACTIRAHYCYITDATTSGYIKAKHDLAVSQIQGACLLLFNNNKMLTVEQISKATGIEESEVQRQLLALYVNPKKRILLRSTALNPNSSAAVVTTSEKYQTDICDKSQSQTDPCDKSVSQTDLCAKSDLFAFSVNDEFRSSSLRICINQIQFKETKEETQAIEDKVQEDRSFNIDACIVRLMKASKELHHVHLLSALFSELKFNTTPQAIKKRIQSLIEREFLERDKDEPQKYKYLA